MPPPAPPSRRQGSSRSAFPLCPFRLRLPMIADKMRAIAWCAVATRIGDRLVASLACAIVAVHLLEEERLRWTTVARLPSISAGPALSLPFSTAGDGPSANPCASRPPHHPSRRRRRPQPSPPRPRRTAV